MVEGSEERDRLEGLLQLATAAELEVRVLSASARQVELAPSGSATCRVGERIWVVLSPDDPIEHQSRVLAEALARYRAGFLEERYVTPALREFIERVDLLKR